MSNDKISIIRPFGPSIAKIEIPKELVVQLNNFVDKTIKDKKKSKTLDHGKQLAGDVKQELRLEADFMDKIGWGKWLVSNVGNWINMDRKIKIT